jgi:hypothetical protein
MMHLHVNKLCIYAHIQLLLLDTRIHSGIRKSPPLRRLQTKATYYYGIALIQKGGVHLPEGLKK